MPVLWYAQMRLQVEIGFVGLDTMNFVAQCKIKATKDNGVTSGAMIVVWYICLVRLCLR